MAESAPAYDDKERRASQTAIDAGLTGEDDAAVLGMPSSFDSYIIRAELIRPKQSLDTSKNSVVTSR